MKQHVVRRSGRIAIAVTIAVMSLANAVLSQEEPVTRAVTLSPFRESIDAHRHDAFIEATLQFAARNVSATSLYQVNACDSSPMYWVERLEGAGKSRKWKIVFEPVCTGSNPPDELKPGDSTVFSSRIATGPGERADLFSGKQAGTYRVVYIVASSASFPKHRWRVISPSVVIRAPH